MRYGIGILERQSLLLWPADIDKQIHGLDGYIKSPTQVSWQPAFEKKCEVFVALE
jgi:hypothetical protein